MYSSYQDSMVSGVIKLTDFIKYLYLVIISTFVRLILEITLCGLERGDINKHKMNVKLVRRSQDPRDGDDWYYAIDYNIDNTMRDVILTDYEGIPVYEKSDGSEYRWQARDCEILSEEVNNSFNIF